MTKSVFEKYKKYDRNIILLSIRTLEPKDRIALQKGYGEKYDGKDGFLYHTEESVFEQADNRLAKRIIEVDKLTKLLMADDEIIKHFTNSKSNLLSIYSDKSPVYTKPSESKSTVQVKKPVAVFPSTTYDSTKSVTKTSSKKVTKPLEEYFPVALRKRAMEYILSQLSNEEETLLRSFFMGKHYNICKKYVDDEKKIEELFNLIQKITRKVAEERSIQSDNKTISKSQPTVQAKKPVAASSTTYDSAKSVTNTSSRKVTRKVEDENSIQVKPSNKVSKSASTSVEKNKEGVQRSRKRFLSFFNPECHDMVLKLVEHFQKIYPNYYNAINKQYSGEHYEIINNVTLTKKENAALNNAKSRIRCLLIRGYLAFFSNQKYEQVIKKIQEYQTTHLEYYEVITKKFSGIRFQIINNIELSEAEWYLLMQAKDAIEQELISIAKPETKDEEKTEKEQERGLLSSFDPKYHDMVLKLIEQFQVTNPNYYETIHKKYSGTHYEIVNKNVELTNPEKIIIGSARAKIRTLLTRGYLAFFDLRKFNNNMIIKKIKEYEITHPEYYKVITKKFSGECFEKINDVELTEEEWDLLMKAKDAIEQELISISKPEKEDKKKKEKKQEKGFLSSFDSKYHDMVLKLIEQFQVADPNDYEAIHKKYSGTHYEIVNNDVELTNLENIIIWSARAKIRTLLTRGYLAFFDLRKFNNNMIIKKIKEYEITHPEYYEVITKKFSGECFEKINDVELTEEEWDLLMEAQLEIKKDIEKANLHLDILNINPIQKIDSEAFNKILFETSSIVVENPNTIIEYYIQYLECFSEDDIPIIIRTIATFFPQKISNLLESSYFKRKLSILTTKEQEYVYLTLLSYSNPFLTRKRISEMLQIPMDELQNYQIMTDDDSVNKLNVLFKKSQK